MAWLYNYIASTFFYIEEVKNLADVDRNAFRAVEFDCALNLSFLRRILDLICTFLLLLLLLLRLLASRLPGGHFGRIIGSGRP